MESGPGPNGCSKPERTAISAWHRRPDCSRYHELGRRSSQRNDSRFSSIRRFCPASDEKLAGAKRGMRAGLRSERPAHPWVCWLRATLPLDELEPMTIISSEPMKKTSALDELLSSGCRADLVRWLVSAAPADFTIADAARALGRKRTSIAPEVQRLERLGVLSSRLIGSQHVYASSAGPKADALRSVVREFESGQLVLFESA